jgi:uncharacterized membrane protein
MSDTLYILAASYDHVDDALSAYEEIEAAYRHVGSTRDFDATVIARAQDGEVEIVRRHDEAARHGTQVGLGWGIAAGAVAVLFPAVGIFGALAVGGGVGAALGHVAKHASRSMPREDLMRLGEVLDRGEAGLVVVYASEMAGRVTPAVSGASSTVRTTTSVPVDQLAADIRDAETAAR